MQTHLYTHDLPEDIDWGGSVAIDTETMGLQHHRDRLCLVQLSAGDGHCHLVHFPEPCFGQSPHLCKLLANDHLEKVFHYGRFDLAVLAKSFGIVPHNVYCTKIASRLTRTYTDRHSLKSLCADLLGIDVDKREQTSDWGGEVLSPEQLRYAGTDVLYLHAIKEKLDALLVRENRLALAQACFRFLPHRAELDLLAGEGFDIFAHK
ncbi:3'-5' exonuclease [Alphaproteobacteria bacterium]|nr:3'-5' exonuclease [Alphaproteobacteria bacterium]GHS95946.1 3'-5' exonuclease [Alphaproteobacteria bacterium]